MVSRRARRIRIANGPCSWSRARLPDRAVGAAPKGTSCASISSARCRGPRPAPDRAAGAGLGTRSQSFQARPQIRADLPKDCHREPVTDVTGVAIRILRSPVSLLLSPRGNGWPLKGLGASKEGLRPSMRRRHTSVATLVRHDMLVAGWSRRHGAPVGADIIRPLSDPDPAQIGP